MTLESVESVPIRRLDELDLGLPDSALLLVKADTQGTDLEALAGTAQLLPLVAVIQVEGSVRALYEDAPHITDTLQWLKDQRFVPAGFFPAGRNSDGGLVDVDIVALRVAEDR